MQPLGLEAPRLIFGPTFYSRLDSVVVQHPLAPEDGYYLLLTTNEKRHLTS